MVTSEKEDKILSIAAFFPIVLLMLQQLIIGLHLIPHETAKILNITLSSIPMIIAFFIFIRRELILSIVSFIIMFMLILISYEFYPDNRPYIKDNYFYLFFINIPVFLCISSIKNIENLKKVMLTLSYWVLGFGILLFGLIISGKMIVEEYNMSLSYYLLLPALVFVYQNKMKYYLIFAFILLLIVLLGSRGPLLSVIFYVFVLLLLNRTNALKNISSTLIVILISLLMVYLINFNNLFYFFEKSLGISSRTLGLVINGEIIQDSGRVGLQKIIIDKILNGNFFGYGVFGDRPLLGGVYVHNIFLEILNNFGVFFGVIIILFLFILIFKTLRNNKNSKFFLVFLFYAFFPLLISGSYLTSIVFGMFPGYLYMNNKKRKEYNE